MSSSLSIRSVHLIDSIYCDEVLRWRQIARQSTNAEVEYLQFAQEVRSLTEARLVSGTAFDQTLASRYRDYLTGSPRHRIRSLKALIAAGRVLSITGGVGKGFCFEARGLRSYVKKLYYLYDAVGDLLCYAPLLTKEHLGMPMSELALVASILKRIP